MSKWIEKRTRPVLPLYLAALTWPVASLILPPYRLVNLVIIAALSTVVYLVSSRFCHTGAAGGTALRHRQREHRCHAERHCRQPGRTAQAE